MSVRIIVDQVVNESLAVAVINENDILVINNVSYPVLSVTPISGAQVEIVCDGDTQPAIGAKIYIKEASGHIPLGTDSIPGLVTKRLRSYMETPNIATSALGTSSWNIVDMDGVPAAGLFSVGDWVRINGIEYLIQSVTPLTGSIDIITNPPAPNASVSYTVYHYIEAGIVPLATATTPGLVPHTYNHAVLRQIDLYIPKLAYGATDSALKNNAFDSMKWMCEGVTVLSVIAINYLSDSGSTPASYRVRNVSKGTYISNESTPNSTAWTLATVTNTPEIDEGDEIEVAIIQQGSNLDTEGLRISLKCIINNEQAGA